MKISRKCFEELVKDSWGEVNQIGESIFCALVPNGAQCRNPERLLKWVETSPLDQNISSNPSKKLKIQVELKIRAILQGGFNRSGQQNLCATRAAMPSIRMGV